MGPRRKRLSPSMLTYAITIFTGAFLLFQVEPLLARYILPWFGGSSAVWITCMLFFQLLLVAGYAYSHLIATRLTARRQAIVHVAIVFACVLLMGALALIWQSPITPGPTWKPQSPDFPVTKIFVLLLLSVGLPFFILSTTGPLLQAWYARSHQGSAPYRLYALSNIGSLLALVTYPFVVEPALSLRAQALLWSLLFGLFSIGVLLCARSIHRVTFPDRSFDIAESADVRIAAPSRSTRLLWIAFATVPSVMLLAATNQLCQQVAVVPFLWVLPLAIYLLSFIICFDNPLWYRRGIFHPLLGVAVFIAVAVLVRPSASIIIQIVTYSMLLFAVCMVCHGELVRLKPHEHYLTSFYLMIGIGGAIGGVFVVVITPLLFTGYWEFDLAIFMSLLMLMIALMRDKNSWLHERSPVVAIALLSGAIVLPELIATSSILTAVRRASEAAHLIPAFATVALMSAVAFQKNSSLARRWPGSVVQACAIVGLLMVGGVLIADVEGNRANSLIASRNFYGTLGVYSVDSQKPEGHYYMLRHGQIIHGEQYAASDKRYKPTTYYGPESAIGLLMLNHPRRLARDSRDRSLRVGAIGLGVGTIAAYGLPGDYLRFYEINPAVTEIAEESGYFTYLRDSRARIEIVPGDARLSMEREVANGNPQAFDVLVLDAFAGDAIPVHLLTIEAFAIYLRELNPDGVIAIHVTNRYLDLQPVIQNIADHFGLKSARAHQSGGQLVKPSEWVVLARDNSVLGQPAIARKLRPLDSPRRVGPWTDDYSNLFQILK